MNQAKQVEKLLTLTAQTLDLRCFRGRGESVCVSVEPADGGKARAAAFYTTP